MKKKIFWILSLIMMIFIFYMSNKNGASSGHLSESLVNFLSSIGFNINPHNKDFIHFIIRKLAHISEYLVLTFLLFNALICDLSFKKSLLLSSIISILYSMTDEFHQIFIPGRVGTIKDVFIDFIGVFIFNFFNILNKYIRKSNEK